MLGAIKAMDDEFGMNLGRNLCYSRAVFMKSFVGSPTFKRSFVKFLTAE